MDRVRRLGRRDDPLAAGEEHGRREDVVLEVGLGADQPVADELREQRRGAVVAQAARVDRRRHEVVAERVHRDERRQLPRVAEVVGEVAARQRRAGGRLAGEEVDLAAGDLLAQEREREPGEVRAAADAADDDVRVRAGELHLRDRLLADHGLVQQHVAEHAAERVRRVVAPGRVLDRLRDRDPEAAGRVGMLGEDRAAGVRLLRRAGDDRRAPRLDHRAPERLLVVRGANHVDLALEAEQLAGEGERAAPLARAGLGREARAALALVVEGLRDGGVRLVAAGRARALVLVEDPRPRPDRLLEPVRAVERRRAPEAVEVEHLLRDRDLRLLADLLEDQLHREERRQVVRPDRLPRPRMEDRQHRVGHVGADVVPVPRKRGFVEQELRLRHRAEHKRSAAAVRGCRREAGVHDAALRANVRIRPWRRRSPPSSC